MKRERESRQRREGRVNCEVLKEINGHPSREGDLRKE